MISFLEERAELLREQTAAANVRLREFEETISRQGVVVPGSRSQQRAHPLLTAERELRRDRARALDDLERVVELEARKKVDRLNMAFSRSANQGSSRWNGSKTVMQLLDGGNLVAH